MKSLFAMLIVLPAPFITKGQYFQYSQYNFTQSRVNPGLVAAHDYASAQLIFRNQSTGGDFHLKSAMLSLSQPFLNRRDGTIWSGLGLTFMDDRWGGVYNTQEVSLSYAVRVRLSRFQFINLGFRGLFVQHRADLDGLYTGSQYLEGRGFDESLFSGETIGLFRSDFITFSTGLYWQQNDRRGRKVAYWGIAFFDFNNPGDSFFGIDHRLSSTLVGTLGAMLYRQDNLSLAPELLLMRNAGRHTLHAGLRTSYEVRPFPNQLAARIDLITKYVSGGNGVLCLQFHRDRFSMGFSYDFPLFGGNPGNTGAFEMSVELKHPSDPRTRKRKTAKAVNRRQPKVNRSPIPVAAEKPRRIPVDEETTAREEVSEPDSVQSGVDSLTVRKNIAPDLATSLRAKADSVRARARAGQIAHEPFVIEKLTLRFTFEFNSTRLDNGSMRYLEELSKVVRENPMMKVRVTGHTDDIGSAAFNMRLSRHRANVVKEHLVGYGVDPSRIETLGKGLTEPLTDNSTETGRALNRRVELVLYYQE